MGNGMLDKPKLHPPKIHRSGPSFGGGHHGGHHGGPHFGGGFHGGPHFRGGFHGGPPPHHHHHHHHHGGRDGWSFWDLIGGIVFIALILGAFFLLSYFGGGV